MSGRIELSQRGHWRRMVKKYGARVFAKTERPHPRPPEVNHLISTGFKPQDPIRYWAFAREEDLDAARLAYPGKFTPLPVNPCP